MKNFRNFDQRIFNKSGVISFKLSQKLTDFLSKLSLWHINSNPIKSDKLLTKESLFYPPNVLEKLIFQRYIPSKKFFNKVIRFIWRKVINNYLLFIIEREFPARKIVKKYFDNLNIKISRIDIDCYLSKPSTNPVINWHRDAAFTDKNYSKKAKLKKFNTRCIKVFIFLNPNVLSENLNKKSTNYPSLAIINGSMDAVRILDKMIINSIIPFDRKMHSLKDVRYHAKNALSIQENNLNQTKKDTLINFLEESNRLDFKLDANSTKYDVEGKPQTLILFDHHAIHRGSATGDHTRLVLRLMFRGVKK